MLRKVDILHNSNLNLIITAFFSASAHFLMKEFSALGGMIAGVAYNIGMDSTARWIKTATSLVIITLFAMLFLSSSVQIFNKSETRMRKYVRSSEFDYTAWALDALGRKNSQAALDESTFSSADQHKALVNAYLKDIDSLHAAEEKLRQIYGDPNIPDPQTAAAETIAERDELTTRINQKAPEVEAIIQSQIAAVLSDLGLTLGGQPIPPVLYQISPLPYALIVSPRDKITQIANISLDPDLTMEKIVAFEKAVEQDRTVSALIVEIGGVGVYPTMVMQTSNLPWLIDTVAHEWIHNYLTLRPLGILYDHTPQLRTMNETVASIAGAEISHLVLEAYYPELVPPPPPSQVEKEKPAPTPEPPAFDFRKEMHETRVTADKLLAENKIEEAEAYMEERRVFLWENGYHIRRLNQAYFAFHGAYADSPQGAAGEDPVGPAVRKLRQESKSLAEFVNTISWMTSFDQLKSAAR